ncbi:hypothetical protein JRO89_XS11G0207300 [Xanthoceras sorbifolium]|uniref:C2 domain-containing protein n=1 Tax=Xanthoceras sorbifolium TaxID=99658 RepID=A0ABQ8HGG6_9ROSI|nr:hypothetical protein JRO89_XS11G0207300 [Xanthoceras sorbifolium]
MASGHEVEVTISSAKDLKNVNWRHGPNKPYAVVWVDPSRKLSTKVDKEGDTCPLWDETLVVPLPGPVVDEDTLCIDIVHAGDEEDTKKLIGSARLKLIEVLEEAGFGEPLRRSLTLKRPSGRPHGKVDVKVTIREPRYQPPAAYYAPPYGVPQPPPHAAPGSREYGYSYGAGSRDYGYSYGQQGPPPPGGYPYYPTAPPPSGYPYQSYNMPPPTASSYSYGQAPYSDQGAGYYGGEEKKKSSKFGGMGTGLAVGAVAGALGGLALAEGFDALEDKIEDDVAEKVEDDLGYDGDDF